MKRVLAILILVALTGCAAKRANQDVTSLNMGTPQTSKIEPEARTAFFQAERAFFAKNYDAAAKGFQAVRTKFPRGKAAELASYRLGSILYYRDDYAHASQEFEGFLRRYPRSELAFDVTYNWAAAEHQQGHFDRAQQVLNRLRPEDIKQQGPRRAVTVYQLAAANASAQGNHAGAIQAYANQRALIDDERARGNIEENIDSHLEKINGTPELDRLSKEVSDPETRSKILQKLSLLAVGGTSVAAGSAATPEEGIESPLPETEETPGAIAKSVIVGAGSQGDRMNIGVVVPLTGKLSAYGRRALDGILLAAKTFGAGGDGGFRIFVEDTGSSPLMAQRAVESLVNEHNVAAVIGPLSYKEALAVGEKAQELGVLNLSLTSKGGVSEKGPYVFQNALTPRVQLENLVKYAMEGKGFRRFAILAPANAFGRDMADEFWSQVERLGGKIVGFEFYEPDAKDFQDEVKALVGLNDPRYRRQEWARLQEYLKEEKARTGREPKTKLQSLVDFDAIFLPDSPKTVASIAANLAYFDVSGVALLGTTEWNSDQLYRRGGRFVESAVFPGVMNPMTRNATQRDFMRLYADAYGNSPDLLAAQAYEAMEMVGAAIQTSGSSSRNEIVKAMASLRDFQSPIGLTSFDDSRLARRIIPVYALDASGNFIEQ